MYLQPSLGLYGFPNPLRGPQHRRGPKKMVPGFSFCIHSIFPFPIPGLAHSLTLFAVLCSTCCYRESLRFFPMLFFPRTFYFSLTLFLLVSLPHECWWHWFSYNWAALEPRLQIAGCERGFTFPENPNLSNLQCCDAWQPSQVFFPASVNPACIHGSKPGKADFLQFCLVLVNFWSTLAPLWPLVQMLRPSKPTGINISS